MYSGRNRARVLRQIFIDGERTMWPKGDFLGVANERVERIAEEMEAAWKDRTVEKNMEM